MPGPPAARFGDYHMCPMVTPGTPPVPHVGGPILPPCSVNVITGKAPQARVGDMCFCVGPPDTIAIGSPTVQVNGMMAARMGDQCAHGGAIMAGCPTVFIGGGGGGGVDGGGSSSVARNSGSSSLSKALSSAAALINPAQQAAVYKRAARGAVPFCERCSA